MKLPNLDRILVNKTSYLFTSIRDSNISRGCAKILEIPEGRGVNLGGGGSIGKSRGEGGHMANPFRGDGMDIFWIHTMTQKPRKGDLGN